jgi:hypothetical protein
MEILRANSGHLPPSPSTRPGSYLPKSSFSFYYLLFLNIFSGYGPGCDMSGWQSKKDGGGLRPLLILFELGGG